MRTHQHGTVTAETVAEVTLECDPTTVEIVNRGDTDIFVGVDGEDAEVTATTAM